MRKFIHLLFIALLLNCSSNDDDISTIREEINLKTTTETPIEYFLGYRSVEGKISITRQASNAFESHIIDGNEGLILFYKANANFKGVDIVEITYDISAGAEVISKYKNRFIILVE